MISKHNFKGNVGCCLDCPKAEPGCLCYDCKCKKCYWYIEPDLIDYDLVDKPCGYKFKKGFKNILIKLIRKYLVNIEDDYKWNYEYKRFLHMGLIPEEEQV